MKTPNIGLLTMRTILSPAKGRSLRKRGPNTPEVIIRKGCTFFEKQDKFYPVPELLLLANRAGFLWLSKVFARCARKTGDDGAGDPDDHEHVDPCNPEINTIDIDEIALRLGILTPLNRRAVFKKYDLTRRKPFQGDLPSQYHRQIIEVQSQWRRVLAMQRQERTREEKKNRQWRSALNELRRKQKRELKRSDNTTASQPRKHRRLFRAVAEVEAGTGVGTPRSLRFPVYVFAPTWREASRLFADALSSAGYKLKKLRPPLWARGTEAYVISRPSPQSMELDNSYIRPGDVLRAWDTGKVLLGRSKRHPGCFW
jgi:hypothetical protein